MKESFWGIFIIFMGVLALFFIVLFQSITNTDQHNSQLLQEVTEAAMFDALDYADYRAYGKIKINKEKFVENFLRRYAESASRSRDYDITFYNINETPPKVTLQVSSKEAGSSNGERVEFNLSNRISAILESPY